MANAPQPSPGSSSFQYSGPMTGGYDGSGSGQGGRSVPPPWVDWKGADPRASSSQSLMSPARKEGDARRTLLVIYIHGFMGNDASFRSFPSHVHDVLKEALRETHFIHSKIYPRYKTYKAIDVARENFSQWLEPHESPTTDVVLIGHSMGGLLAAEVVLAPNPNPYGERLRHRILGTISLDAPLLGLHPGIVVSGIASLFRPAPKEGAPGGTPGSHDADGRISPDPSMRSDMSSPPPMASPSGSDPSFNPPFFNDVAFKDRGWLRNVAHFAQKHSAENLFSAATNHVMSHLEFGGCLADYPGMHSRYNRLRALEDVNDRPLDPGQTRRMPRVRFVNYYTASTGRPKPRKETDEPPQGQLPGSPSEKPQQESLQEPYQESGEQPMEQPMDDASDIAEEYHSAGEYHSADEDHSDGEGHSAGEDHSAGEEPLALQEMDPIPEPDDDYPDEQPPPYTEDAGLSEAAPLEETASAPSEVLSPTPSKSTAATTPAATASTSDLVSVDSASAASTAAGGPALEPDYELPPIPPPPPAPVPVDLDRFADKDARKQAEKEAKRRLKEYDAAVKNRERAIRERQKLVEKARRRVARDAEKRERDALKDAGKRERDAKKDAEKRERDAQKDAARRQKDQETQRRAEEQDLLAELEQMRVAEAQRDGGGGGGVSSPAADAAKKKERKFCMLPGKVNGQRDAAWLKVYMDGMDEVGAHCGLFLPGPHNDLLVGDVSSRIVGWVHEDATRRAMLQ